MSLFRVDMSSNTILENPYHSQLSVMHMLQAKYEIQVFYKYLGIL